MHASLIAKRTIAVDGKLDDWQGVLPQTIRLAETSGATLTEQAWFPFKAFDKSLTKGFGPHASSGVLSPPGRVRSSPTRRPTPAPSASKPATTTSSITPTSALTSRCKLQASHKPQAASQPQATSFKLAEHGVGVEIWDAEKNRRLDRQHFSKLWDGTYAVYHLAGKVRIRRLAIAASRSQPAGEARKAKKDSHRFLTDSPSRRSRNQLGKATQTREAAGPQIHTDWHR